MLIIHVKLTAIVFNKSCNTAYAYAVTTLNNLFYKFQLILIRFDIELNGDD